MSSFSCSLVLVAHDLDIKLCTVRVISLLVEDSVTMQLKTLAPFFFVCSVTVASAAPVPFSLQPPLDLVARVAVARSADSNPEPIYRHIP